MTTPTNNKVPGRNIPFDKGPGYTCPELGRTCYRPGAYDFLALPSLINGKLVSYKTYGVKK